MSGREIYIAVDRRENDGQFQLAIGLHDDGKGGHGYRLCGPKYDGTGTNVLHHVLTERDVEVIRTYLRAFPRKRRK